MQSIRRRPRQILALVFSAMAAFGAVSPFTALAGELPTGPTAGDMDLSPFYRWTEALPIQAGTLLRKAPMPGQDRLTAVGDGERILYTSTDVRWNSGPIPVSGVLYRPKGAPPQGGWPLVAWGHGTVGIADVCAPSWTGFKDRDAAYLNRWLEAGFAVVATDYQGLGGPGPHPYHDWRSEGRSMLDSARAALADNPGVLANAVLLAGQSQGSGAALGAAELAHDYAPELNVIGAVATGLVATFPDGPLPQPVRNSANVFFGFASGGLRDDGPRIDDIVSPAGLRLLQAARTGCTKEVGLLARELNVGSLAETLSNSLDDLAPFRIPVSDMPMERIAVPILIATGLSDATVSAARQYAAVSALCASANRVTWKAYEGLGHDGAMHGSFDSSLAFAHARLAGETQTSNCAEIAPPGPPGPIDPNAPFNAD